MSFLSEVHLDDKFGPFVAFQRSAGICSQSPSRADPFTSRNRGAGKLESALRLQEGAISRIQKERILLIVAAERKTRIA